MARGTAGNEIGAEMGLLSAPALPAGCSLQLAFTKAPLVAASRRFSPFVYINNPGCVQAQTLGSLSLVEDALIFGAFAT